MPVLVGGNATRYAVASNVLAIAADLEAGNRRAIEACARNEGLLGYLVADPNDIEASRDILHRWGDESGIVGVKVVAPPRKIDVMSRTTASRASAVSATTRVKSTLSTM